MNSIRITAKAIPINNQDNLRCKKATSLRVFYNFNISRLKLNEKRGICLALELGTKKCQTLVLTLF